MLSQRHSFSVPGSAGTAAECERVGHTEPDRHGKCYRCSAPVEKNLRSETVKTEYVELLDGPFSGQIVSMDDIQPFGRTNIVTVDGVQAIYDLADRQQGMVRMHFRAYLASDEDIHQPTTTADVERIRHWSEDLGL